ncbi:hypothetical protein P171DRAFT_492016 [Karstenula rhodostoma CBS 690.94]|uniref:Uncharacterized protein n=1 Tax=Karstenula rhodostoma CBS 690.94 TaxID=1392251 RepID=A0A9P4U483_9PLEO|nr:hypothetical protein P171DRAFT_492016 [Karstenula rhodostoma CBS 690.94]
MAALASFRGITVPGGVVIAFSSFSAFNRKLRQSTINNSPSRSDRATLPNWKPSRNPISAGIEQSQKLIEEVSQAQEQPLVVSKEMLRLIALALALDSFVGTPSLTAATVLSSSISSPFTASSSAFSSAFPPANVVLSHSEYCGMSTGHLSNPPESNKNPNTKGFEARRRILELA